MTESVNYTRYQRGQNRGHYESFFQRANHPSEPVAFWIRYTIFSPDKHPENAIGEIWAVFFDGIEKKHIAVKKEIPFEQCICENNRFNIKVGDSILRQGILEGNAQSGNNSIEWNLNYSGDSEPLFVLPEKLYSGKFPKAKLLAGLPLAEYTGTMKVNGRAIEIKNWIGSQNHNWGVKHTDHYAWGQVAGFDNSPDTFFEVATARMKVGPIWTPFFTLLVLRHNGTEYRLNSLWKSIRAIGKFTYYNWYFCSENSAIKITGNISAEKNDFAGLKYYNPPGGIKHCLNTKIASCEIHIEYKNSSGERVGELLETKNRAAFEILTDDNCHGIEMIV